MVCVPADRRPQVYERLGRALDIHVRLSFVHDTLRDALLAVAAAAPLPFTLHGAQHALRNFVSLKAARELRGLGLLPREHLRANI